MGMHKTTLKAAVSRYSGFFAQGDGEDATKAEIAKDPKGFSSEDINEIYDALVAGVEIDDKDGEGNEGHGNEGENLANQQSGPPGGSTNPPPPFAPASSEPNENGPCSNDNDDEPEHTKEQLDPEELERFVKSLTPEQAQALYLSIGEIHGLKPSEQPVKYEKTEKAAPTPLYKPGKKYVAVEAFRDSQKFDHIHSVGDDVSHFEPVLIQSLLNRGLIKEGK